MKSVPRPQTPSELPTLLPAILDRAFKRRIMKPFAVLAWAEIKIVEGAATER